MRICKIYQKPVTREDFEGEACLIGRDYELESEGDRELGLERWLVRFLQPDGGIESSQVSRLLYVSDIKRINPVKRES